MGALALGWVLVGDRAALEADNYVLAGELSQLPRRRPWMLRKRETALLFRELCSHSGSGWERLTCLPFVYCLSGLWEAVTVSSEAFRCVFMMNSQQTLLVQYFFQFVIGMNGLE